MMPFLLLLAIPAGIGIAMAFGKKRTVTGPDVPDPERSMLTGTAGDYVYQVEALGSGFRWAVTGPAAGAGAGDKIEGTLRDAYGFVLPLAGESASVTGALGPYTFAVDLQPGGDWRWSASDLGGGGAASAEQGTMGSRGAAIIRALQWLVERGAADWLAAPKSLPEGPVGGPAPGGPKPPSGGGGLAPGGGGGAPKAPGTAGAAQIEGDSESFPGLTITAAGGVHLTDARAWQAFARPIIAQTLASGGPSSVGNLAGIVFGDVPGAHVTFNGKSRKDTWAQVGAAIAKIKNEQAFVPDPAEWLANLLVAYYPSYKGSAQTYRGHVLVTRPNPGAPAISAHRWWVFDDGRELDENAEHQGVAASAADSIKLAKQQVDVEIGEEPKGGVVQMPKDPCLTTPAVKTGSVTLANIGWWERKTIEFDVGELKPKADGCHNFRVTLGLCVRTQTGATYGLMDFAADGWPPAGVDKDFQPIPSRPAGFESSDFKITGWSPIVDVGDFQLPGAFKQAWQARVEFTPGGTDVSETEVLPTVTGTRDACPGVAPQWLDKDVSIEGDDGTTRPWKRPTIELYAIGKRIRARLSYSGLPVFDKTGRASMKAKGGGMKASFKSWSIGEG